MVCDCLTGQGGAETSFKVECVLPDEVTGHVDLGELINTFHKMIMVNLDDLMRCHWLMKLF